MTSDDRHDRRRDLALLLLRLAGVGLALAHGLGIVVFLALALLGPGRWSLDHLLARRGERGPGSRMHLAMPRS